MRTDPPGAAAAGAAAPPSGAFALNPDVVRAVEPPVAEAQSWVAGRAFPPDRPLLDLAQAVPSYPPAAELRAHLAGRAREFETARYTSVPGIPELRAAIARRVSELYGGPVGPENVLVPAGCNQAYCLAVLALARAGDEVLLPAPWYFNHAMWLDMLGARAVPLPFRADRGGVPDPEEAARLLTPRTRAIVLVTPNNPTGAVYPPETVARFRDLAAERGIALVLDETYRDFLDGGPPHGLFRDPRWGATVVQLYSFSKVFSLAGYRVGALVAGEPLVRAATKIMDTVSICAPRVAQDAALYGLENLSGWAAARRDEISARREAARAALAAAAPEYEIVSSGAYFLYLRHPFEGVPARDIAERLARRRGVLCLPGPFFGPGQERCLRLACANAAEADMPELARRLAAEARSG